MSRLENTGHATKRGGHESDAVFTGSTERAGLLQAKAASTRSSTLGNIPSPSPVHLNRHRHPTTPCGELEGEAAVFVALEVDAVWGDFVSPALAGAVVVDQA